MTLRELIKLQLKIKDLERKRDFMVRNDQSPDMDASKKTWDEYSKKIKAVQKEIDEILDTEL